MFFLNQHKGRNWLNLRAAFSLTLAINVTTPTCSAATELSVDMDIGPIETIVSWSRDKCEDVDIPDTGLRVFRRYDDRVIALASHYISRSLIGSNVSSLKKNGCHVVFASHYDGDPAHFDDQTWLAATWTDDGRNITAIGHNEYHGEMHPGMCAGKTPRECRYGALTLLISRNGGDDFGRAALRPIAAVPEPQNFNQNKDVGFFQPSNIFEYKGLKYVFVRTSGGGRQPPATCLMRANNPMEPGAWEIFDGEGFSRSLFDPYKDDISMAPICAQVSTLNGMVWSVLRHRQRDVYIAILTVLEPGTKKTRLATSVSKDLLHWTTAHLIDGINLWQTDVCSEEPVYLYPSLIDPQSPDRNFDTTDDDAILFMTAAHRKNCKMTLDRDLISRSVRFVFSNISRTN